MGTKFWFEDSRSAIISSFGEDADLFSRLLAGTSPVTDIRTNVRLACKAYQHLKWFGELQEGGFIHVHVVCIQKFLDGRMDKPETRTGKWKKQVGGRKVWSLYQNLIGNEEVCPIDRWMLRYFGYDGETRLTVELYDKLENKLKEEAKEIGCTPAQHQCQLWCSMRMGANITSGGSSRGNESYGDIINRLKINRESLLNHLL